MDTSETYIKMCEKADEIQNLKPSVWGEKGYWWKPTTPIYDGGGIPDAYVQGSFYEETPSASDIWLPCQDQLQEMMGKDVIELVIKFHRFCNPRFKLGYDQNILIYAPQEKDKVSTRIYNGIQEEMHQKRYLLKFNSMEQLWLALVMKEKYNKVWDGNVWSLA